MDFGMNLRTTLNWKSRLCSALVAGCVALVACAAAPVGGQTRATAAGDAPESGAAAREAEAARNDRRPTARRYDDTVNAQDTRTDDRRYDREDAETNPPQRRPSGANPRVAQREDDGYSRGEGSDDGRGGPRDNQPRRTESRSAAEARAIDPRAIAPRATATGKSGSGASTGDAPHNQSVNGAGGAVKQAAGQAAQQNVMNAPFQLAPQQQQFVDELLAAWEKQSGGIKTFECDFTRWEYSAQFAVPGQKATAISSGELKFVKPDKGLFHDKETQIWNTQTNKYEKSQDPGQHWICDGKSVWELNALQKQIKEQRIPPEMQGVQIADGPLPFMLFGGEAAKIKARYFIRERTDPKFVKEEIWLEAFPKWQRDAQEFESVQLIMKRTDFLPYALRLYSPGRKEYKVYEFKNVRINNPFFPQNKLAEPSVPRGWQLIRDKDNAPPQTAARPAVQPVPRQAQRPQPERPAR
jgi:TIGR03009 family protein